MRNTDSRQACRGVEKADRQVGRQKGDPGDIKLQPEPSRTGKAERGRWRASLSKLMSDIAAREAGGHGYKMAEVIMRRLRLKRWLGMVVVVVVVTNCNDGDEYGV